MQNEHFKEAGSYNPSIENNRGKKRMCYITFVVLDFVFPFNNVSLLLHSLIFRYIYICWVRDNVRKTISAQLQLHELKQLQNVISPSSNSCFY